MAFIFDTNIFIRSKNGMPMEIWPSFWTTLFRLIKEGEVFSCQFVRTEIERGDDELTEWLQQNAPSYFFIKEDLDISNKFDQIQTWAQNTGRYNIKALLEFASVADVHLVATAAAKGHILVTYEKPDPYCKKRVKIPDACQALNVRVCDLNQAFRELNVII